MHLYYYIYSEFPPETRNDILNGFNNGEFDVLIGTNLVTRGMDLNVNHVINFDLPTEYNEYVHRCGRVGRNGKVGYAHTFIDLDVHDDYSPEVVKKIAEVCFTFFVLMKVIMHIFSH